MRLYIANCTKQTHDFVYIVPEAGKLRRQSIPIGGQAQVHDDCDINVLSKIVQQHEPYGLVSVNEIQRRRGFIGLCYSIGEPIDLDTLLATVDQNEGSLVDSAIEIRKVTAVAIEQSMREQGVPGLTGVEVEVVEEDKGGDAKRLAEGVTVGSTTRSRNRNRDRRE